VHHHRDGALNQRMDALMQKGCCSARWRILTITTVMVASAGTAVLGEATLNAGDPGERKVVVQSRFDVANAPLQADVVQFVVDFPSGAWTSWHIHGGQAINLVLEGEITLRHAGMEQAHRAGQAWSDSSGQVHAAGNTGLGKARLLTNFLLPHGAPQITVVQDSTFEPTVAHEAKFPLPALTADTEIAQQVVELPPGLQAERTSVGFMSIIIIAGEVTYKIGTEGEVRKAGEAFSMPAGTRFAEENRSAITARVFTTCLTPKRTDRYRKDCSELGRGD
jgi:quercetin dioxygenase-like cupin family protein